MKESEFICKICNKVFQSGESLAQHKSDRHERVQKELVEHESDKLARVNQEDKEKTALRIKHQTKRRKKAFIVLAILASLVVIIFISYQMFTFSKERREELQLEGIPSSPIHWHPHLTIIINGETQPIPTDIGILSNVHYPIHTHETDGTIHMENDRPNSENVRLGYFFKIWGKPFNEQCILDMCIDQNHEIKMYINGKENFEYGQYFMQDKDDIKIEYLLKGM